jgi:hypothetical protein
MKTKALQVKIAERSTDSLWSWVVCTSSFFIQFLVCGVHNSFGTFFVALLNKFGRSEAETGEFYFCFETGTDVVILLNNKC